MDVGHSLREIKEWTADEVLDRLDWLDACDEKRAEQNQPPPGNPFSGGGPFGR